MRPAVLVIGGTDPSGGAGVQRDALTLAAMGLDCCPVISAVTAQSHRCFTSAQAMPPALVRAQVLAAFDSADIRAIKTGMLANADTINALLACLKQLPEVPLVVDPVLITSSGHSLLDPDGVQQLLAELVPRADIITPNLPEARSLCPASVTTSEALGVQLLSRGPGAVLLKGGHDQGPRAIDLLVQPESPPVRFTAPRLPISMRGTGCMLATGIAAGLARGMDLRSAVAASHQWLQQRFSQACQTNTTLSP